MITWREELKKLLADYKIVISDKFPNDMKFTKKDLKLVDDLAGIIHLYNYGSVFNGLDQSDIQAAKDLVRVIKERKYAERH